MSTTKTADELAALLRSAGKPELTGKQPLRLDAPAEGSLKFVVTSGTTVVARGEAPAGRPVKLKVTGPGRKLLKQRGVRMKWVATLTGSGRPVSATRMISLG